MHLLAELKLRLPAYIYGVGEFATNAFRNARSLAFGEDEGIDADLRNKVCLITGGNAGIGFSTARELAKRGCKILLACRSVDKGLAAAEAGRRDAEVEVLHVKLGSLESVHRFCEMFNRRQEPLDILILNAGVMGDDFVRKTTEDGFEEHFHVNHLSQWLIAHRLISEQLRRRRSGSEKAARQMRVVILSSFLHMAGRLDFSDLQFERSEYSGFRGYSNSKLMNVMTARQLQRLFDRSPDCRADAAVAVHPGLIQTGLAAKWLTGEDLFGGVLRAVSAAVLTALSPVILETPSRAARTVLYAALAPSQQIRGQYVADGRVAKAARVSHDAEAARKLWEVSLSLCKQRQGPLEKS